MSEPIQPADFTEPPPERAACYACAEVEAMDQARVDIAATLEQYGYTFESAKEAVKHDRDIGLGIMRVGELVFLRVRMDGGRLCDDHARSYWVG